MGTTWNGHCTFCGEPMRSTAGCVNWNCPSKTNGTQMHVLPGTPPMSNTGAFILEIARLEAELSTLRARSAEAFAEWLKEHPVDAEMTDADREIIDDMLARFNEEVAK